MNKIKTRTPGYVEQSRITDTCTYFYLTLEKAADKDAGLRENLMEYGIHRFKAAIDLLYKTIEITNSSKYVRVREGMMDEFLIEAEKLWLLVNSAEMPEAALRLHRQDSKKIKLDGLPAFDFPQPGNWNFYCMKYAWEKVFYERKIVERRVKALSLNFWQIVEILHAGACREALCDYADDLPLSLASLTHILKSFHFELTPAEHDKTPILCDFENILELLAAEGWLSPSMDMAEFRRSPIGQRLKLHFVKMANFQDKRKNNVGRGKDVSDYEVTDEDKAEFGTAVIEDVVADKIAFPKFMYKYASRSEYQSDVAELLSSRGYSIIDATIKGYDELAERECKPHLAFYTKSGRLVFVTCVSTTKDYWKDSIGGGNGPKYIEFSTYSSRFKFTSVVKTDPDSGVEVTQTYSPDIWMQIFTPRTQLYRDSFHRDTVRRAQKVERYNNKRNKIQCYTGFEDDILIKLETMDLMRASTE